MVSAPHPLAPGDLVRIVAPCGCFEREAFLGGVQILEQEGLRVRFDSGIFARDRYLAGDDERRLAELEAALREPEVCAVWVARGGYGATRIAPQLSLAEIAAAGRWLIGFSDVTALHALWTSAGLVSVHGPNVTTLGSWSPHARNELFKHLLHDGKPTTYQGEMLRHGGRAGVAAVQGRLVGGNLTVLASMTGTMTLPSFDDAILLIEDVGERPYRLDRYLTQLRLSGALTRLRGVAVGQLKDCSAIGDPGEGLAAVTGGLAGIEVPMVAGLPFGHESSARAVFLGGRAVLDVQQATLTVRP
jgi:muramoyltetrapeptide carboxypeptidase